MGGKGDHEDKEEQIVDDEEEAVVKLGRNKRENPYHESFDYNKVALEEDIHEESG